MHGTVAQVRNQVAITPGFRIAIVEHVLDPGRRYDRIVVSATALHDQLTDPRQVENSGAYTASAPGRAETVDRDIRRGLSAHRLPEQVA
jgi:hypothetical protein